MEGAVFPTVLCIGAFVGTKDAWYKTEAEAARLANLRELHRQCAPNSNGHRGPPIRPLLRGHVLLAGGICRFGSSDFILTARQKTSLMDTGVPEPEQQMVGVEHCVGTLRAW